MLNDDLTLAHLPWRPFWTKSLKPFEIETTQRLNVDNLDNANLFSAYETKEVKARSVKFSLIYLKYATLLALSSACILSFRHRSHLLFFPWLATPYPWDGTASQYLAPNFSELPAFPSTLPCVCPIPASHIPLPLCAPCPHIPPLLLYLCSLSFTYVS